MSLFTLLVILMFSANLILACFSYFLNPKSWLHRIFSLYLIVASYQLLVIIGYSGSHSFAEARIWWRLDILWPLMYGLFLPFVMLFVKRAGTRKSKYFLLFHFTSALLIIIVDLTTERLIGPPVETYLGWTYTLAYSSASSSWTLVDFLLSSLSNIWFCYVTMASNYLLLRFYFSTKIPVEKTQTLIILLGILIAVVVIFVRPALSIIGIVFHDSSFILMEELTGPIANLLFAYSIFKYGDNRFTQLTAANPLPVLMVGSAGCISYINEPARELLGYSVRALLGTPLETILSSASGVSDTAPIESPVDIPSFEARIKINSGREVPVFVNGVRLSGKDSGSTMLIIKKKVS
jgi:PAS domain-containing protein